MAVLDMVCRAEVSRDLSHREHYCAVDTLGAVGLAAINDNGAMAAFRVKYLNDFASIDSAKQAFILWARRSMIRRGMNPSGASRLGTKTLMQWMDDKCASCNGLGYPVIDGSPTLSSKPCPKCKGSGSNYIEGHGDIVCQIIILYHQVLKQCVLVYS